MADEQRVVAVTGGTQGIGRAIALAFARDGWSVAVLGRSEARLRSTEAELAAIGGRVLALPVDVADAAAVDAAAERVERELGPMTVWVNNAMAMAVAPADRITPDEFRRVTDVTYHGQVFGTLAALRFMRARGRGQIIQVSSGLAMRSAPLQAAYCGAKHAVTGFTDSLRAELIHDGVDVALTVVYLPAVNTPQFDRSRNHTGQIQVPPDPVFDPRLCAEAVLAAAHAPTRDVWVGRSTMMMGLMQLAAPGFSDRQAAKMYDAQVGSAPPPLPDGNLFEADDADPGVDGSHGDRVSPARREFVTSRARDALAAGLGLAATLGVAALALLPAAGRRPRG